MPYQKFFLVVLLVLSQFFTACSGTIAPSNQFASPPATQAVNLPRKSVQKVVALTPLTADILYQLAPNKLVGVPGSKLVSHDPRFKELPAVTSDQTPPNLEKIIALKPDLVIGARGFHDRALQKFQELGIQTLATKVDSWQALADLTKNLGELVEADPAPLLKHYQTFLTNIPNYNPSALVLVSRQPILAPNKNSWAGDFLKQFKIKNVAAQLQGNSLQGGYVTLSPEKILEVNPEVIILVETGGGIAEQFKADPFWNQLQASKRQRVYVFDYYGLVNPGSIGSIEKAASQLKEVLLSQANANSGERRLKLRKWNESEFAKIPLKTPEIGMGFVDKFLRF
ncbi:MAG: ABC transporter substrate-binding protein [Actinomycetota bacterium]